MRQLSILATMAALVAIVYFSCTPKAEDTPSEGKDGPVMREVSEMVSLMFEMEADMKMIRSGLVDDSTYSQVEVNVYKKFFTAKTSKDVKIDSVFVVKGNAFLKELHRLSNTNARDSAFTFFNNAVNACITCHENYCPGPVARIKKLRIE